MIQNQRVLQAVNKSATRHLWKFPSTAHAVETPWKLIKGCRSMLLKDQGWMCPIVKTECYWTECWESAHLRVMLPCSPVHLMPTQRLAELDTTIERVYCSLHSPRLKRYRLTVPIDFGGKLSSEPARYIKQSFVPLMTKRLPKAVAGALIGWILFMLIDWVTVEGRGEEKLRPFWERINASGSNQRREKLALIEKASIWRNKIRWGGGY